MDTLKLEYFVKVYERNNLTRAAEELFITQPALSQAITSLEKELQCTLFKRDKKHLIITPEGKFVYNYAKKILSSVEQMKEMVLTVNNEKKTLRIKAIDTMLPRYLASKYLVRSRSLSPDDPICTAFTISGSTVISDVETLKSEISDIVITNRRISDKDIKCIPLFEEKTYVNLPKGSPFTGKGVAMLKDFENTTFLRSDTVIEEDDIPQFYNTVVLNNYMDVLGVPIKFEYMDSNILYYMWNQTTLNMFSSRSSTVTVASNVIPGESEQRVLLLDEDLGFMYYLAYLKEPNKLVSDFVNWLGSDYKSIFNGMNITVTNKDY